MRIQGRYSLGCVLITGFLLCGLASCVRMPAVSDTAGIQATSDPQAIERGRYLVYGPAHCVACHGDPARDEERLAGVEVPLSGGKPFDLGIAGTVVAPNITSDPIAGIGGAPDGVLVMSLRYGISWHGRPLVPLMSFAELSDDDLVAVLSYLRSVPPVAQSAPPSDLSVLGALGVRLVVGPQGPSERPAVHKTPAPTAEYGRYLVRSVANCRGCHTRRSTITGAFTGAELAGGTPLHEPGGTFVPPDLTPTAAGIAGMHSEEEFIARFRVQRRCVEGSPMPWEEFARMSDTDLAAVYRYLRTLPSAAGVEVAAR